MIGRLGISRFFHCCGCLDTRWPRAHTEKRKDLTTDRSIPYAVGVPRMTTVNFGWSHGIAGEGMG
jgi:hypothetical protein